MLDESVAFDQHAIPICGTNVWMMCGTDVWKSEKIQVLGYGTGG